MQQPANQSMTICKAMIISHYPHLIQVKMLNLPITPPFLDDTPRTIPRLEILYQMLQSLQQSKPCRGIPKTPGLDGFLVHMGHCAQVRAAMNINATAGDALMSSHCQRSVVTDPHRPPTCCYHADACCGLIPPCSLAQTSACCINWSNDDGDRLTRYNDDIQGAQTSQHATQAGLPTLLQMLTAPPEKMVRQLHQAQAHAAAAQHAATLDVQQQQQQQQEALKHKAAMMNSLQEQVVNLEERVVQLELNLHKYKDIVSSQETVKLNNDLETDLFELMTASEVQAAFLKAPEMMQAFWVDQIKRIIKMRDGHGMQWHPM